MKNFICILLAALFLTPQAGQAISAQTCNTDDCVDFFNFNADGGPNIHNMGNETMLIKFRILAAPGGNRTVVQKGTGNTHRFFIGAAGRFRVFRARAVSLDYDFVNPLQVNNSYQVGCSMNIGGTVDEFVKCFYSTISAVGQNTLIQMIPAGRTEGSGPLTDDSATGFRIGAPASGLGMAVGFMQMSSGALTRDEMQNHFDFVQKGTGTIMMVYDLYRDTITAGDFGGNGITDTAQGIEVVNIDFPINFIGGSQ